MKGKTFIVIAHRISTIRDSDMIFVFRDGQICEKGGYEGLMKKQGEFYKIAIGNQ